MKYQQDYYQTLGVRRNATLEEIRNAYRQLVKLNHPDRNSSPLATERMQAINEAYAVIGDQSKRTEYDFAYFGSSTVSQTKDSFYTETANLQVFSAEENPMLFVPLYSWFVFFLIATAVCSAIMMLISGMLGLGDSSWLVFFGSPLGALGLISFLVFGRSSKSSEKENQCPQCGRVWAAEKLDDKLLGIFQKAVSAGSRRGAISYVTCEKYQIHYKCNYCSYEWLFNKIRKI